MTEPSNPYDFGGDNPYGDSGSSSVPKTTKPRQEPSGSRPADPMDAMISETLQMQQEQATKTPEITINQQAPQPQGAPGAPGGAPGAAPGGAPAPAPTPGAQAAKEDAMVRYVLASNPKLTALSARTIVRMAEDLSAPTHFSPQVVPTMNFGQIGQNVLDHAADSVNDIQHRQHQQSRELLKGTPIHPMDRVDKNPLKQYIKDRLRAPGENNPKVKQRKQDIRKEWLEASPEDHKKRLTTEFQHRTHGLDPDHPEFQQAHAELKAGFEHQNNRIQDAFNKHVSDSYQLHRSLREADAIPANNPNWDKTYFYRNTYALQHPHKWQHMFPGNLPSYEKAQQWQAGQAGSNP